MTTSPILEDVAAYVDVWSSEKNANCSKPFVQQLQEMGAQVTKTFNKQVTHVVFKNGHPATWRKAKKSGVKLVSVLWVSRCYEDGVRVDEELYPALNDESNPVLKNKKHRCMQPRDSPEKTPENDKRMRKKLDRMMKNLQPVQPIVTEVSPIIIDEESGIVYSPALKRSDYMARRLKDMKEKHEYLSPTASQMVESCSPTGLKPSLGSTPTVLKLTYDQSDDDSSASPAEPSCSPDKGEGRTKVDAAGHDHLEQRHRKDSEKSWLSPCRDVPKRIPSQSLRRPSIKDSDAQRQIKSPSLKQSDFVDEKDQVEKRQKKSRLTSVRKKTAEKQTPAGSTESPHQTAGPEKPHQTAGPEKPRQTAGPETPLKNIHEEKRRSRIKPFGLSPEKSEKGKPKAAKETKTRSHSDTVTSSSCLSLPAMTSGDAGVKQSKETSPPPPPAPLYTTPKRARQSFSALVRSFTEPRNSKCVASCSNDGDDNVFEDYFSPVNLQLKSRTPISLTLPVEENPTFQIPFELDSVPSKKKQRRSESIASQASSKKKRKLEGGRSSKNGHQSADASSELQSHQQQDVKEPRPSSDSSASSVKPADKRRRKSAVPMTNTDTTTNVEVKKKRASISVQQATLTETKTESKLQKNSAAHVLSHDSESRGNERTNAAGSEESPSEGDVNLANNTSSNVQKTVNRTTAMRTLVMTSMPTEKQQTVVQVVKSLGGFYIADQVCESTTHVVSGSHRRTLNILLGIARGCWILSFEWILWCLEQRQWIPEEPYELSDQFPAAQICRLQRHLSAGEHQQDLFEDQPVMFVSQHSQPPTQSLMELIQLCGGKVCKTVRQAGICIGKYSGRRPEGSRILSEQWVLDSITHLKQLSYDNYDLEQGGEKS